MPLALLLAIIAAACSGDDERHLQLVFDSERGGNQDIFVMRDDGKEVRQLTDAPGRDYEPNASDDGSMIVFVSDRDGGEGEHPGSKATVWRHGDQRFVGKELTPPGSLYRARTSSGFKRRLKIARSSKSPM